MADEFMMQCYHRTGTGFNRWRDSKTKKQEQRTVSGVGFLRLVLQHVLPKGFRRARNYGFLHHNRAPQAALPMLRRCHGNRASAHLAFERATGAVQPRGICRQLILSSLQRIGAQWVLWLGSAKISNTRLMGPR
jgi:hypothetical protein